MTQLQKALLASFLFGLMGGYQGQAATPTTMLPEVVVTATRTENTIDKVPAAMEIITADDIKKSGAYDLRSLLARESGVIVKAANMVGDNEVMIRGTDTDKTLILVNGKRQVNEADIKGLANKNALGRINLAQVERVEILKGPSSALYGSDAIGGVVNIITKKNKEKAITMGAYRTKTTGEMTFHVDSGRQGNIAISADAQFNKAFRHEIDSSYGVAQGYQVNMDYYLDDNHYFTGNYYYFSRHLNRYEPGNLMGGMPGKMPGGHTGSGMPGTMSGGHTGGGMPGTMPGGHTGSGMPGMMPGGHTGGGMPGTIPGGHTGSGMPGTIPGGHTGSGMPGTMPGGHIGGGMPGTMPGGHTGSGMMKSARDHWDNFAKREYGISYHSYDKGAQWQVRAYGGSFDWDDIIRYSKNGIMDDINVNKNQVSVLDGQMTMNIDASQRLTFGGEYVYNHAKGTNLGKNGKNALLFAEWMGLKMGKSVQNKKYESEQEITTKSLYIQDEITCGKWFIVPALRYDYHSVFGSHVSPKLGVTYIMNPAVRVKMNYGNGFRAPNIGQLYYNMTRSMGPFEVTVNGNSDLKPETSKNFDISVEINKETWNTSLSYYDNRMDNLITSKLISKEGNRQTHQLINVNKARIHGVEHVLGVSLTPNIEVRLVTEWMSAKDTKTDQSLPYRPEISQTLQFIYDDHSAAPFTAMLWIEQMKNYAYDIGGKMKSIIKKDSYHTWNFTMSKEIYEGTRVYGSIENIFDVKNENCKVYGRFLSIGVDHRF